MVRLWSIVLESQIKLLIKSAHDITIEAILSFFDFTTSEPISYAARIVIETWKIENEEKIKILYQGQ